MGHIELARWAEYIVIAPASCHSIAKISHGLADDLLTTLCLASKAQVLIAPAMNQQMWLNGINAQNNINILKQQGMAIFGPAEGEQACGDIGPGRMLEPDCLFNLIKSSVSPKPLKGKIYQRASVAGPTQEAIDPVRYVSNHSSGKMGFAIAQAAVYAGATVNLITGPVNLPTPIGVNRYDVCSAQQMLNQAVILTPESDIFIEGSGCQCNLSIPAPSSKKSKNPPIPFRNG